MGADAKAPLLEGRTRRGATPAQTLGNIVVSIVGTGVLGLPYAFRTSGWLAGALGVAGAGAATFYCMLLLRQATGARSRGGSRRQLHLRRPRREMLRRHWQILHRGHHHPFPDRRLRRLPRLHRPEHLLRLPHRRRRAAAAPISGRRRPHGAPAGRGRALLHPLTVVAGTVQHPRRRVHRPGRGHRRQGGPPASRRPWGESVRGAERVRRTLGRPVRLRRRRVLLRGVLPDARAGGVHVRPEEVPAGAPPGHRRRHRRVRLLRRVRLPRLRRRHQRHRDPEPSENLVHRRRQDCAVHCAGAHVPDDDAPDPRDRGGAAVPAGQVGAEMPGRRRARGGAGEPRGGGGGGGGGGVLRAGIRGVRVVRGEHGVRAALLRAAGAVPHPRRRSRGERVAARGGRRLLADWSGFRRPWAVHGRRAPLKLGRNGLSSATWRLPSNPSPAADFFLQCPFPVYY